MAYLLDTNTCLEIIRDRFPSVRLRFQELHTNDFFLSVVTYGELLVGAEKKASARMKEEIAELTAMLAVLSINSDVAEHYARIRAHLEARGEIIGANDLWIAAHALSQNLTLVTENLREFKRVPGLKVENWVRR